MQHPVNVQVFERVKFEQRLHTWTELAELLGVSESTLRRWRKGATQPGAEHIARMVVEFGIPFQEIIGPPQVLKAA